MLLNNKTPKEKDFTFYIVAHLHNGKAVDKKCMESPPLSSTGAITSGMYANGLINKRGMIIVPT